MVETVIADIGRCYAHLFAAGDQIRICTAARPSPSRRAVINDCSRMEPALAEK